MEMVERESRRVRKPYATRLVPAPAPRTAASLDLATVCACSAVALATRPSAGVYDTVVEVRARRSQNRRF
jgi:hypothetical protein